MKIPFVKQGSQGTFAGHIYEDSKTIRKKFTLKSRFGDKVEMFKELKNDRIMVPIHCGVMTKDYRVSGSAIDFTSNFVARSQEQTDIAARSTVLLSAGESHIMEAATGFGKTIVATEVAGRIGKKFLVIVPKDDIVGQWVKAFQIVLGLDKKDIGLIQGDTCTVAGKKAVIGMVHSVCKDGRYPSWIYKEFGLVIIDECLHPDMEILTQVGWKLIKDLQPGDQVAQWNDSGGTCFVFPTKYIEKDFDGELVNIVGNNVDLLMTPTHQQPYRSYSQKTGKYFNRKRDAINVKCNHTVELPVAGCGAGSAVMTPYRQFQIMTQADGYLCPKDSDGIPTRRVQFSFSKQRKILRFFDIVTACGFDWVETKAEAGKRRFTVKAPSQISKDFRDLVDFDDVSQSFADSFIGELVQWDGSTKDDNLYWSSTVSCNADWVQGLCALGGWACSRGIQVDNRAAHYKDVHRLLFYRKSYRNSQSYESKRVPYRGKVYCVRVPDGNIIVRRNNKVTVTGNCHVISAKTFSNAMWLLPAKLKLGLSATPYRQDGKDFVFYGHIGPIKCRSKQMTLVPKVIVKYCDYLIPTKRVPVEVNGQIEWHDAKDYTRPGRTNGINSALADSIPRNRMIAEFVLAAYKKGRNIIVFSELRDKHLGAIELELIAIGVKKHDIGWYVGGLKKEEREWVKGKRVLLSTYKMASMATDIPWLDTCVLATPRTDVVQIVGRILREYEDKREPVVFDIVDNDCKLFVKYFNKRMAWYTSISSEVVISK